MTSAIDLLTGAGAGVLTADDMLGKSTVLLAAASDAGVLLGARAVGPSVAVVDDEDGGCLLLSVVVVVVVEVIDVMAGGADIAPNRGPGFTGRSMGRPRVDVTWDNVWGTLGGVKSSRGRRVRDKFCKGDTRLSVVEGSSCVVDLSSSNAPALCLSPPLITLAFNAMSMFSWLDSSRSSISQLGLTWFMDL